MDSTFYNQAIVFALYLFTGMIICLLYDIFRALRKTIKTSDITTFIEDIIYWTIVLFILIYLTFVIADGNIRLFMYFAIGIGRSFLLFIY